jgi:hypothetical protein
VRMTTPLLRPVSTDPCTAAAGSHGYRLSVTGLSAPASTSAISMPTSAAWSCGFRRPVKAIPALLGPVAWWRPRWPDPAW